MTDPTTDDPLGRPFGHRVTDPTGPALNRTREPLRTGRRPMTRLGAATRAELSVNLAPLVLRELESSP
jgi:hypothetical protein